MATVAVQTPRELASKRTSPVQGAYAGLAGVDVLDQIHVQVDEMASDMALIINKQQPALPEEKKDYKHLDMRSLGIELGAQSCKGDLSEVKQILKERSLLSDDKREALFTAARSGHKDVVLHLLSLEDISEPTSFNEKSINAVSLALYASARAGQKEIVIAILENHAKNIGAKELKHAMEVAKGDALGLFLSKTYQEKHPYRDTLEILAIGVAGIATLLLPIIAVASEY